MEHLDSQSYCILGSNDVSNRKLEEKVQQAVMVMHTHGFVHGDLRDVNIMACIQCPDAQNTQSILILDLDWAGQEGSTNYPQTLNHQNIH